MAIPKVNNAPAFLNDSLDQLNDITNDAYNNQIRQVALDIWKKHLRAENPQWKFITAESFTASDNNGSAHVMAMVDERLPDLGIVGYFACTNSALGANVLKQATDWLRFRGLKDVYGPINGTLPSDYRLNLSDDFAFPGEPVNPAWHIDAFNEAGFDIFNRYASGKLTHYQLILKLVIRKPHKDYSHITTRPFDTRNPERDFETYHELRNVIFPSQSIYCPAISLEERIYNSSEKFDPDYTYFLVDDGREVGFIMAYAYKDQLILKTIGLLPEYHGKRLTGLLLKLVHDQAAKAGLKTAIYGMVRIGNSVYKSKHPAARVFRHYVTMHKSL